MHFARGGNNRAVEETTHEPNYSFLTLAFIMVVIGEKAHSYETFG